MFKNRDAEKLAFAIKLGSAVAQSRVLSDEEKLKVSQETVSIIIDTIAKRFDKEYHSFDPQKFREACEF